VPTDKGIRQLIVVHLSDVHFGPKHRFAPPPATAGDVPEEREYPTLLEKLSEDLTGEDPNCPLLLAVTGDFVESGSYDEFKKAQELVKGLTEVEILGRRRALEDIYLTPGNHDVSFAKDDIGERWQQWTDFYNRLRGESLNHDHPWECDVVDDRVDDLGAIVITINSAVHVQKDKIDQDRGRVDIKQIETLQDKLESIDPDRLISAVRVALIHHHPVLIPDLVEPGRGYDAVHNSGPLLTVLRKFGFHVVLHGHKHNPHVFTEDGVSAYRTGERRPILVVAGGSLGSTGLPAGPRCGNCYNSIIIKWNYHANQARIRTTTRGLEVFDSDGTELLPGRWNWRDLRIDDRQFLGGEGLPTPQDLEHRPFDAEADAGAETERGAEYKRLHFNLPVAAVMPSLEPDQVNEARLWIVKHPPPEGVETPQKLVRVTWSAGRRFPVMTVEAVEDPTCAAIFHYWGPMLVQARLEFADGTESAAHTYVRLPEASHTS
jgi:hypothetical protein